MHDPIPPPDNNEIEPIYNPATSENQSPVDDSILDIELPYEDIEPIYNPATMEFVEEDNEDS